MARGDGFSKPGAIEEPRKNERKATPFAVAGLPQIREERGIERTAPAATIGANVTPGV